MIIFFAVAMLAMATLGILAGLRDASSTAAADLRAERKRLKEHAVRIGYIAESASKVLALEVLQIQAEVWSGKLTRDDLKRRIREAEDRWRGPMIEWCEATLKIPADGDTEQDAEHRARVTALLIGLQAGTAIPSECASLGIYR
jgi:cell division protein FtsI/penicillin-binding protein 2